MAVPARSDGAGLAGLLLIGWFFWRVNAFDPFIYRGGMLLLDVICVVEIGRAHV